MKKSEPSERATVCVIGWHDDTLCGIEGITAAQKIGETFAAEDVVVLSPGSPGFALWVAQGTSKNSGHVVGVSPAAHAKEHASAYRLTSKYHDAMLYSGFGYQGAMLQLMRSSDAILLGCNDLRRIPDVAQTYMHDRPVGLLLGSWGRDESFLEGYREVISSDDPVALARKIAQKAKHHKKERMYTL